MGYLLPTEGMQDPIGFHLSSHISMFILPHVDIEWKTRTHSNLHTDFPPNKITCIREM